MLKYAAAFWGIKKAENFGMDVVDRCYYEMRRYRNLVSYYTNKNIAVSYLRARKKNDLDRVMRLYGDETSKYW